MLPMPSQSFGLAPDAGSGLDMDLLGASGVPPLFEAPSGLGAFESDGARAPIVLQGRDLERLRFRVDQALSRAKRKMRIIHEDAKMDREVYRTIGREVDYPGQPNLTTPISANKADGLRAQIIDAMEQNPIASFKPEGVGRPAERAAQVAPLAAAYLEREINLGGSREYLVRSMSDEAVQVGTGIGRLAFTQHPSGEWFVQLAEVIPLERFYTDRLAVPNLKHAFCGWEKRIPYYQLDEMADAGLIDRDALESMRMSHSAEFIQTPAEEEAEFDEGSHAFEEETAIHKVYPCYIRFRASTDSKAHIYEMLWSDLWKTFLSVRKNSVAEAYDHPPLTLHRIGKDANSLLGRGVVRRLDAIQQMADNAINTHLAINNLAASPPFLYRQHSPFGRLLDSKRRIVPGIGIPSQNPSGDQGDVQTLNIQNPGLAIQDVNIAQTFADRATYTEEAIGSTSDRKTLGQFRVEMNRGTMRVRLDLGDLAYDAARTLTMMWAMMVKYKIEPAGIVEVEKGGRYLGAREISDEEITEVMDGLVMPRFASGELTVPQLQEIEEEFNARLTDGVVPSARRSDLSIHLTGTKILADKAADHEMLNSLTPLMLQGLELARRDTFWNYHMRTMLESMGFKDISKRIPADPGEVLEDPNQRAALAGPLADTVSRSSNMF